MAFNIYERLVSPKFTANGNGALVWDGLQLQPQLADFTLEKDTATFKIRSGAKFYPSGNPLTADDVIYTIQRLFALGMMTSNVSGIQKLEQVKKVDDHTVTSTSPASTGSRSQRTCSARDLPRAEYGIIDSVEVKKHVTKSDPTAPDWLTNTRPAPARTTLRTARLASRSSSRRFPATRAIPPTRP